MTAPVTIDDWADQYGALRPGGAAAVDAWIGIPVIVASVIGMLWAIPLPGALQQASPVINWATFFLMAAFVYYCILSIRIALTALVFLILAATPSVALQRAGLPTWPVALGAFVPAFCWQLMMTRRATGNLLVLRNLQYLMLGPVWLLRAAFRRAGVAY